MHPEKIEQYHLHKEHPEKLQLEIYDLNSYFKKYEEPASKPHSHSYYQILWFFKKEGKHFIDFNGYPIEDNTVFFITKNQIHYFEKERDYEGIIIHFNEDFLRQSDVDIFLKYNVFNNQGKPCYCISEDVVSLVSSYLELMQKELKNRKRFGHQEVIRYLLKSILIIFERTHRDGQQESLKFTDNYQLLYLRFREFLEQYFFKNYSVQDYAALLNISSKTLVTITKTITSKSPSSLISERIILEAKRLLSFTGFQINEVAYRLGFEDASYFVKYFKRHTGKSPGDYRKITS
ncbi:helix-turn-helix domain-containing protein [Flavobacteriaceae bacterium R38]|nr:helix-turn-helix domain-containing protein [Flavobacteriaceae bacterium R38]